MLRSFTSRRLCNLPISSEYCSIIRQKPNNIPISLTNQYNFVSSRSSWSWNSFFGSNSKPKNSETETQGSSKSGVAAATVTTITTTTTNGEAGTAESKVVSVTEEGGNGHGKEKGKRIEGAVDNQLETDTKITWLSKVHNVVLRSALSANDIDADISKFGSGYWISESNKKHLLNSAFFHLQQPKYKSLVSNLDSFGNRILLSGPKGSELLHENIAKALAKANNATFVEFDIMRIGRVLPDSLSYITGSVSLFEWATDLERGPHKGSKSALLEMWKMVGNVINEVSPTQPAVLFVPNAERLIFVNEARIECLTQLFKSRSSPLIIIASSTAMESAQFPEASENTISSSQPENESEDSEEGLEYEKDIIENPHQLLWDRLATNFPNLVFLNPPTQEDLLKLWNEKMVQDEKFLIKRCNANKIVDIAEESSIDITGNLSELSCLSWMFYSERDIEKVLGSALVHALKSEDLEQSNQITKPIITNEIDNNNNNDNSDNQKQQQNVIETEVDNNNNNNSEKISKINEKILKINDKIFKLSEKIRIHVKLEYVKLAFEDIFGDSRNSTQNQNSTPMPSLLQSEQNEKQLLLKAQTEHERAFIPSIIQKDQIKVRFDDIGALEDVKRELDEIVALPLRRPELFKRGNLAKACKGILLFGPPGTGKTMLAKAVASESGANFINVTMSQITSRWFGDGEKRVGALFSLAQKMTPCVVFIDEADSLLGRRGADHEAMHKIKNQFMMLWDGLTSDQNSRVLVMCATNRPFDLDEAVLRRLPRRIFVGLPNTHQRESILYKILKDETLGDDVAIHEIANLTHGFSGSDLKNLCVEAAHQPVRELLTLEMEQKKKNEEISDNQQTTTTTTTTLSYELRPICMRDFKFALTVITPSVSEDAISLTELKEWHKKYGKTKDSREIKSKFGF